MKRVFIIVLDSFGIGALPDAKEFGDKGCSTVKSLFKSGKLHIPNLKKAGLGNIEGLSFLGKAKRPAASYGRAKEVSRGKDSTIGHWEIAGIISEKPLPVYPDGFPGDVIDMISKAVGRGIICNKPYSGTEVIVDYGPEHEKTGDLIVYTSADSVFQIAAHEDVVPVETLYLYCLTAREILTGDHAVGRVIARPFSGIYPDYVRLPKRHDYSIAPPAETFLDIISGHGLDVISIGKIIDLFAGKGITQSIPAGGNEDSMHGLDIAIEKDFHGLCFANLVDFDTLYGHRDDIEGYTDAINRFDAWLDGFLKKLNEDDALIITADHGCDPGYPGTDHTREYVPILVFGEKFKNTALNTRNSFSDIAQTVCELLDVPGTENGESFADLLY